MEKKNNQEYVDSRLNDPKLDKAWEYVGTKYGISRENLTDPQKEFLANGASTVLIPTNIKDKEGKEVRVSLRLAISQSEVAAAKEEGRKSSPDRLLVTMPEEVKTRKNCFKEDGKTINPEVARFQVPGMMGWFPITSNRALDNLLSAEFKGKGENKKVIPEYANAGILVKTPKTEDKEFILSLNRFTNTFVAMPASVVYNYVKNLTKLGDVDLTDESKRNLSNGRPVVVTVTDQDGVSRDKGYQFDVAKMMIVEIPLMNKTLSEVESWRQKPEKAQEEAQVQQQEKVQEKVQEKSETKKEAKGKSKAKTVKPVEVKDQPKKETKGKKMKV